MIYGSILYIMRFKVILMSKTGYLKKYNTFSEAKTE